MSAGIRESQQAIGNQGLDEIEFLAGTAPCTSDNIAALRKWRIRLGLTRRVEVLFDRLSAPRCEPRSSIWPCAQSQ